MAAKEKGSTRKGQSKVRFDDRLVLNQWMLSLFEVKEFEHLAEPLKGRLVGSEVLHLGI
ncbi:hypothetical protein JXA88_16760 [Candidatus Fermentibacteria bacterium]|nr:hypothetical protein [Candidatus Fermentibacteria bacterium]